MAISQNKDLTKLNKNEWYYFINFMENSMKRVVDIFKFPWRQIQLTKGPINIKWTNQKPFKSKFD